MSKTIRISFETSYSTIVMIGQSILQYQILEKIGEKGMGIVYKALDTTLDRTVAIRY